MYQKCASRTLLVTNSFTKNNIKVPQSYIHKQKHVKVNPAQPEIVRSERLSVRSCKTLEQRVIFYFESKGRRCIGSFPTSNCPFYLLLLTLPTIHGTTTENTLSGQLRRPSIFFCPHSVCILHLHSVHCLRGWSAEYKVPCVKVASPLPPLKGAPPTLPCVKCPPPFPSCSYIGQTRTSPAL